MKLMKLSAMSAVILGTVAASPAVHAHASYILNGGTSSQQWLNGAPNYGSETQDPTVGANMPIRGFSGDHGATTSNNRVLETGVYGASTVATTAALGGTFGNYTTNNGQSGTGLSSGNITPGQGNTLLGQLYNYNTAGVTSKNPTGATIAPTTIGAVSVAQGSWSTNLSADPATNASLNIYNSSTSTFNSGLLYEQPYAGSGSTYTNAANSVTNSVTTSIVSTSVGSAPNGEEYIIQNTGATYLNVAISADHNVGASNFLTTGASAGSNTGTSDISYAIYQGEPTGPGLQGLTYLGSGVAGVGNEADFSVNLAGYYTNNEAQTAGAFVVIVGDASQSTNSSLANYIAANNFDPYVKLGIFESGTGIDNVTGAAVATSNLNGAYATVYSEQGTAPVPVPGAVWLFGSALAGFVGFGRRKTSAAS
jgi:hypothetical protein